MIRITLLSLLLAADDAAAAVLLRLDRDLAATPTPSSPRTAPRRAPAPAGPLRLADVLQSAAAPRSGEPRVGEVYVDQTLAASDPAARADGLGAADDAGPLGPGRELRSVEYATMHRREDGVTRREQGATLSWSRETLDYGFLSADMTGRLQNDSRRFEGDHGSGLFRLRQEGFVVGERWLTDSTLGDQVASANPLVARSFRFSLPSSFVRGAGVHVYDERQELRVQAGRIGDLDGERVVTFEADSSTLAGIGYSRELLQRWTAGLQFWSLRDDEQTGDHASAAAALEYRGDGEDRYQLHVLQSSGGKLGAWADADRWLGAWRHRYGAFRLEPGLQWLDDSISNDRQGLYWRGDLRASRYSLNIGTDLAETNLDGDPGRAGAVTASGFLRGTWLARRDTQLGATLDLRLRRDGRGAAVEDENRTAASAFVSRRWGLGTTRLQADTAFTRGEVTDHDEYGLSLDHSWLVRRGADLSTRLGAARERGTEGPRDELSFDALARFELPGGLSLTTDANASVIDAGPVLTRTYRLNARLDWQIAPQWRLDLSNDLIHTRSAGAGTREIDTNIEVFLRLRWSEATGSEPAVLGLRGTTPGTGRITGIVFFDENRDGVRSPGEQPVADVLVLLDGRRATARTDAQGRYEFWPVFTGEHELGLRTEELPLPWGLDDETPVRVTVTARGAQSVDFALVRLDQ